jgi:histidine phosphotransferase ChpT
MNLAQLAADALPFGGVARVELERTPGRLTMLVKGTAPRVRLHAEVAGGIAGAPLGEGLAGRWVQAYYLFALVRAAGGTVGAETADGSVSFIASLPG